MTEPSAARAPEREIHRRAQRSLWVVLSRQGIRSLLTFGSGIVLARTLAPADFGVFAIAAFVVVFARLLADVGLPAALIQRFETLGERDLQTAFTIQQVTATVVFALLWPAAAHLPAIYPKAPPDIVGLVRLLSADLYLTSWCRPSEALLERSLRYARLAPIDVMGAVVYGGIAIALALGGFGVWSFPVACLSASCTRLVLLYRAAPWRIRFAFDRTSARALLTAGFPLQVGRVVAEAQYWITPTLVAGMIGPTAAGLLQWAAGNGRKPLDVLEYFARVSLPHFSRLQHDEAEVERTLTRYVSVFVLACGLWLVVLAIAGSDLVVFVYTERWLPAVPAMVLFAGVGLLVAVRVIVSAALAGLGRTMVVARVSVATALATLAASVPLVLWLGPIGVPLGQIVGAAGILPFLIGGIGGGTMARVLAAARPVLLPMAAAIPVGLLAHRAPFDPMLRGLLTAGTMTLTYLAVVWWSGPTWLREAAQRELARFYRRSKRRLRTVY